MTHNSEKNVQARQEEQGEEKSVPLRLRLLAHGGGQVGRVDTKICSRVHGDS